MPSRTRDDPAQPLPAPPGPANSRVTEAIGDGGPARVIVQRFSLRVTGGPDAGTVHQAAADRVVVGTHDSADLVLQDPAVSRFHCEISANPDGIVVRDLGSLNGTLLDGVSVLHARARSGSTLAIGRTQLQLQLGSDHVEIELSRHDRFGLAVGNSPPMKRAFALLERAAPSDTTILLEGETGTGKEIIAESIHQQSPRRDGPFIVVDCGAIPHDLLESELFGHERGAFTGAVSSRDGAFEAASGGTLFLDEIGELDQDLQPKLLRALEKREVKRVGANKPEKVDVRLVAATNRNLRAEVNAKRFRPDLYYRLAVVQVRLPPLRERAADVPLLVECILGALGAKDRPEAAMFRDPKLLAQLAAHAWPGNVRELRNYIERCLTLAEATTLEADASAPQGVPSIDAGLPIKEARERWVSHFERSYLEQLLERHGGNVTAAARAAGVERPHMYRLLWRHGLR